MDNELTFRIIFIIIATSSAIIKLYFHLKSKTFRECVINIKKEGRLIAASRNLFGIPFLIAVFIYMISPQWMMWSVLPLPIWLRWIGAGLGVLSVLLFLWTHRALGSNFSGTLHIKKNHTLITHGPYRWVRHPLYTAILMMFIAFFFLSANWFIGLLGVLTITLIMVSRTKKEEKMMIEKFRDEYGAYMKRTGRFLPRLIR